MRLRDLPLSALSAALSCLLLAFCTVADADDKQADHVHFSIKSVTDGDWSDAKTWEPARVPKNKDRVLIRRGTSVRYNVKSKDVIRLLQIVGTLRFADDRDTKLNVGLLKVQNSDTCSESGFACDFHDVNEAGEPIGLPGGPLPALLVGTPDKPIPAEHTARIRLDYLDGMNKDDAPQSPAVRREWKSTGHH